MKIKFKKIIFLTLLLPILSYSQVRFGVKGALQRTNVSKIHGTSEGRVAFAIGGVAQVPIGYDSQYFFQPEVIYSLEGEKDEVSGGTVKYFQNYVNVPLMFRAYFSEAESEFFGELGPQLGFLVSQKNKDKDLKNYGDKPKSFNVSIGLGMGYSIWRRYEVSLRYNYGLVDVYKNHSGQQRTSNLALVLSYVFD